jgi:NADPH:quinone reductase-like Zn-dependent oxidoreductase
MGGREPDGLSASGNEWNWEIPMKALRTHAVGGPETLTLDDVSDPVPGAGQVVVAMKACSINFPDTLMIRDLYQFKPERPFAPGGNWPG